MKYDKKNLALLLALSLSLYPNIKNVVDEVSDQRVVEEDNSVKVICKFKHIYKMNTEDVVSILNSKNEVVAILGIEPGDSNDTYIRLDKGKYRIYSSSGFDQEILIDDILDTYLLEFNYLNKSVKKKKIVDVDTDKYKTNLSNNNEDTNFISSDLNFNKEYVESNNLDYSKIMDDGYIQQGYTIVGGTYPSILISAYKSGNNSRIYIFERESGNYEGYITLPNKNHVGGITYDPINDVLFITGSNGSIKTYDYSVLMKTLDNANDITDDVHIDLTNKVNSNLAFIENDFDVKQQASTLTFYNNALYSIDFGYNGVMVKSEYNVVDNMIVSTKNTYYSLDKARCVQGMAFYEKDNDTYLVLSSSLGVIDSKLTIYKMNNENFSYLSELTIDSNRKMEGISVDKLGNISSIFEGDTESKLIATTDEIIDNKKIDYINNILYDISGFGWDIGHDDGVKVKKK